MPLRRVATWGSPIILARRYARSPRSTRRGGARRSASATHKPDVLARGAEEACSFKYAHDAEHFFEGMRLAGLPEQ